jgi:hypothetical protein
MLNHVSPSSLFDTNDEGLRKLVHDRLKVFAIFTAADCPVCDVLEAAFVKLNGSELAQGIAFVRLNADQNPVAKRLMAERVAPFFVSYCQGQMQECGTCETEGEMDNHFSRLRAFVPKRG